MLTSDIKAIALDLAQAHVDYHAALIAMDKSCRWPQETGENDCVALVDHLYAKLCALQNRMNAQAEAIAERLYRYRDPQ